jgi:chaperonin GroES
MIQPLRDYIVVRKDPPKDKTRGGIIVPESVKDQRVAALANSGIVVAAGPGRRDEKGGRIPLDVRVGDRVLWGVYFGSDVEVDGVSCLLMRESDITALDNEVVA